MLDAWSGENRWDVSSPLSRISTLFGGDTGTVLQSVALPVDIGVHAATAPSKVLRLSSRETTTNEDTKMDRTEA